MKRNPPRLSNRGGCFMGQEINALKYGQNVMGSDTRF